MDYTALSKEMSRALRHKPWEYELELDENGYVPISQLLTAFNETRLQKYGREITEEDFKHVIEIADKERFSIDGDRICALYGHTIPMHIKKTPEVPPDILYHGTSHKALPAILQDGLKPMRRQYVHLSVDKETAKRVGTRKDKDPVLLTIDAKKAYADGVAFYTGNDMVKLTDFVPTKYLTVGAFDF